MADWFRNTKWDENIEAAFEAKLSRARDKAQYLNIQAHTLLPARPRIAAALCLRAIALGDPVQTARAWLYLGTALAIAGDVDGAIEALEGAIEAEKRYPLHRTEAHIDQALLVAVARRVDLYNLVLSRLERERQAPYASQEPSAMIAWALIGNERGEDVAAMAAYALESLADTNDSFPGFPNILSSDDLKSRLQRIADS